jgi:hypothetical protein
LLRRIDYLKLYVLAAEAVKGKLCRTVELSRREAKPSGRLERLVIRQ